MALCGQDCQPFAEGGAEQAGCAPQRDRQRKGLVKLELLLQGFRLDTNLTTQKEQGNFSGSFFFYEWSLPPAKTTCSPPLEVMPFFKMQSSECRALLLAFLLIFNTNMFRKLERSSDILNWIFSDLSSYMEDGTLFFLSS